MDYRKKAEEIACDIVCDLNAGKAGHNRITFLAERLSTLLQESHQEGRIAQWEEDREAGVKLLAGANDDAWKCEMCGPGSRTCHWHQGWLSGLTEITSALEEVKPKN